MPVEFVQGDLFEIAGVSALAHGCNCAGAMGKGIAIEFRRRWPAMFEEYRRLCKSHEFRLGDVFVWEQNGITIFNLGTQRSWKSKAEPAAIERGLSETIRIAEQKKIHVIALPRIGAGLGGLDWSMVKRLIEGIAKDTKVKLLVVSKVE